MSMKLRIEIGPDMPEEIVIRAPALSDEVLKVQKALNSALDHGGAIAVKKGDTENYLQFSELLYFETAGEKLVVHTPHDLFVVPYTLSQLADILPQTFVRSSKSCIINTARVRSITRSPTGIGQAFFDAEGKSAFISRMYYQIVRDTIEETRLK